MAVATGGEVVGEIAAVSFDGVRVTGKRREVFKDDPELLAGERARLVVGAQDDFAGAEVDEDAVELVVVLDVFLALLAADEL